MKTTVIHAARWIAIIALFTIPLLPLYVSNSLFFPFITGKGFAFRILVEIALASYVLLALFDRRYRPRFSWTLALFGGFVLWMAVANVFGVNPLKAFWSNFERMDGWVTLIHLLGFFLVASSVLAINKLWRAWWLTFVSIAAFVCAYGLLQITGSAEIHQGGARVDASFGNAIYMAVYLMFAFAITLWQAIESKGWLRYSLLALALIELVVLFFSASRGAMIGLVGGAGIAALLWLWITYKEEGIKTSKTGIRIAVGALVGLVLVTSGLFLARDTSFVQNDPSLARLTSVFSLVSELKVRTTIWSLALQGVAEDPITGWGQEGFNQVFNKYYDPSLYAQEAWFDRAHNAYIDWLVAGGVPALLLFIAFLISAMLALYRDTSASKTQRVILVAALVAYAIQALVVFDNLFSYVPLVALLALAHGASSRPIARFEQLSEPSEHALGASAVPAVVVVAVLVMWSVNVAPIRAANHLVYAVSPLPGGPEVNVDYFKRALADGSYASQEIREQFVTFAAGLRTQEGVSEEDVAQIALLALEEMGKEIAQSPNDARLRLQYALAYDTVGDHENALAQVDAALALSPNKQALIIKRGLALLQLKRNEEALAAFRQAYELDTSFPQVAIAAAVGQMLGGDIPGGKALLSDSLGTTTLDDDSLLYAYYMTGQFAELIAVAQLRVALTDGDPEARYRLAQVYGVAGRFDAARAEITLTMAAHPETRPAGEALMKKIFVPAR